MLISGMRPIPSVALLNNQSEVSVYLENNWPKHSWPTTAPYEVEITKSNAQSMPSEPHLANHRRGKVRADKKIIKRDSKDKITMITGPRTF